MHKSPSQAPYLLLVALIPPMGTVVLVVYYFAKLSSGVTNAHETWAYSLIAFGGGLSALMSVFLAVSLLIVYKQRNRLEYKYRKQHTFLNNMLDERLRMARSLDVLGAAHQVTLAIKQENSFERIGSVVLEQIEFFSRAQDVIVLVATPQNELEARARRFEHSNSFGAEIDISGVDMDVAYEAMLGNRLRRHFNPECGEYVVAVPYATPDGLRGVVCVHRNVADDPDFEDELQFFEASLQQLVKAVSVGLKFSALWDRAIKDEMTGLYNKNHFNSEIMRTLSASIRSSTPMCMIMLDVDKFKNINDTHGHLVGDQILRQISAIMLEGLRESDMAFRFGGEELCVICTDTVDQDAAAFAERLRSRIAHTEFRTEAGDLVPLTASIGVAEFDPESMGEPKDLKQACDEALYEAKNTGRNVVIIYEEAGSFISIERSGDPDSEVKRRLGLAGDDTPLKPEEASIERRAKPKVGKMSKLQDGEPDESSAKATKKKAPRKVAAKKAPTNKRKSPDRRKKTSGSAPDGNERRKAPRRKTAAKAKGPIAKSTKAKKASSKKTTGKKTAKESAVLKAIEAKLEAERNASDDSDRLDYVTDSEASHLLKGKAPKKSERASKTPDDENYVPRKHW